jgi:hypothetical protein
MSICKTVNDLLKNVCEEAGPFPLVIPLITVPILVLCGGVLITGSRVSELDKSREVQVRIYLINHGYRGEYEQIRQCNSTEVPNANSQPKRDETDVWREYGVFYNLREESVYVQFPVNDYRIQDICRGFSL